MTQRTKCTCQLIVGITGSVMGVAAWATAGRMALLGNWLPSSITMCGVVSCELYGDQDREYVIARYDHGGKREIDVTADSYLAIIKDVTKRV